jgi:hypothetical protein
MPWLTTGPATSREPPLAFCPFTVSNSRAVSTSQITAPVEANYPRKCPSTEPEKTAPEIAVTAADCAGLHSFRSPQLAGFTLHTFSPLAKRSAKSPPPWDGSSNSL